MIKRLTITFIIILFSSIYSDLDAKTNVSYNNTISSFKTEASNINSILIAVDKFSHENLEVLIYESKVDTIVNNISSKFEYEFDYKGIMRGVNLAEINFSVYRTDPLTNTSFRLDSISITYHFSKVIPTNYEYFNPFFSKIANQEHLEFFSKRVKENSKLSKTQSKNVDWYNENLTYYKFFTEKDGIARISHSDLIRNDSELIGKNSVNIVLFNRGNKIKLYSTSNVIQHNEYFYFVGSHAVGDTSYYDFYNGKEPYFVTYDENENSELYERIDNLTSGSQLTSIRIKNHYEVDKVYGNGFDVTETEQSICENWFEDEIRPPNNFNVPEIFTTNFTLFPQSDLNVTYNFANNIFYLPEIIKSKTKAFLNTYNEDTLNTSGSQVVEKSILAAKSDLLNGGNTFGLNVYKAVEDSRRNAYNGVIGFDYLEVEGDVKPISENDYFSFIYNGDNSNYVQVEGFSNSFVVSIDTVNNTIQFPNTEKASNLIFETKGSFISFYSNYQIVTDYRYGYYIVESLGNLDRVFFFQDPIKYLDKLASINKVNIATIINLDSQIPNNVKSKLTDLFEVNAIQNAVNKYILAKQSDILIESVENLSEKNVFNNNFYKAKINLIKGSSSRKIINSLSSIKDVELKESKLNKISESDYDAIYLYHPTLSQSIDTYTDFMSSQENKSVLSIDVEQLYDSYGFGIESPHSIKNFLQQSYNNWEKFPEFLVLIGDATWDPKMLMDKSFVVQMIPAYGIPYSDNFYGVLEGDDQIPEMIIGRIPVNNNQELLGYLDKLKTYYSVPQSPWMKKILQLSGGNENQKESFAENMHDFNVYFNSSNICFDTTTIGKTINSTISEDKANDIKKSINEGKIWVNFLGHGSPHVIDMSGWEAPNLNNKGKYGVLNTLSCNTSAFAEPHTTNSIGEEYVTIANKGFVATIGGTSTTFVGTALLVSTAMYATLIDSVDIERNLGRIYNSYKPTVGKSNSTLNQVVLLGDPLLTVRIPDKPDVAIFKQNISLTNNYGSGIITELDKEVNFESVIYNLGTSLLNPIRTMIVHTYNGVSDTSYLDIDPICFEGEISFILDIENKIGDHILDLKLDFDSTNNDFDYSNNNLSLRFGVFPQGIQPLDPQDYWNVSTVNPLFRFIDPTGTKKEYKFSIYDKADNLVYYSDNPIIDNDKVDLIPDNLINNNEYTLKYRTKEIQSGIESSERQLDFYTTENIDSTVKYTTRNWNENLKFNNIIIDDNKLVFDDIDYDVFLSSARGRLDGTSERHSTINTTNKQTGELFTYVNRLKRGFSVVVLPDLANDTNYTVLHLDTWDSNFDKEDILKHSRWLDRYLRDSLNHGDYLFIASADVPMRAPQIIDEDEGPDSVGSATRIIEALNDLGAKYADSLDFDASYVLFTRVGYPDMTIDRTTKNDTIQLETTYTRYQESGTIEIPNIGNIRQLISMDVDSDSNNIKSNIDLIDETNTTIININNTNLEFNDENGIVNKNLSAKINIVRDSVGADYSFESFNLKFVPVPELAINNIDSKLKDSVAERAVSTMYDYVISNISPRSDARNVSVNMNITNNFSNIQSVDEIPEIVRNSSTDKVWNIETADLALENKLSIIIDSSRKINEIFYFNNEISEKLRIREDTTKPYLVAYYKNELLENGDRVSLRPLLVIELYDESNIDVIKDNVIFARVNSKVVLDNTTDTFNFELLNDNDLKARLTFQMSDSLDIGQNILKVVGEDATGNKADTLEISIYVPNDNRLENSINYPNPFSESTTIKYDYIGKNLESWIKLLVFDALGKLVYSDSRTAIFGENELKWNGLNSNGMTTSSGIYYYQLKIENETNSIVNGKMMKIN